MIDTDDWFKEVDGNGWPKSWGMASRFGPMGVLHAEPFPHYAGEGCNCPPRGQT